ncbi:MAG: LacI family DNA-binding transcriptional regulator [Bauldia sp.]|nr:LacI family DNA-binding transcriptional regulator [Bauldia sp.]
MARAAGVSQPTVSRAFSRPDVVSQETLERIHSIAAELGYRPNELARSLISRKSNVIGLVMGDILNPFYPAVLHAFTQSLQKIGRRVMLFSLPPGQDVDEIVPQLMQYQVAGVVITSATLSSRAAEAFASGSTPLVLFNRTVYGDAVNSVSCANEEAGRLVARTLVEGGHRRFGLIGGFATTSTHIERRRAFVEELRRHGITELREEPGGNTYEGGYAAAKVLLSGPDRPDALFCISDIMALGALDAARRDLSLNVPGDVSIVGFDDIAAAAWPSYDLTTVRQPVETMTAEAIAILIDQMDRPDAAPVSIRVPGELVIRSSARVGPAGSA